jgi:MFS family permease
MISKVMMGMGYAACFTAGAVRVVKSWFFKHQGLVVSLISMASGLGGSLMTVVLTNIIEGRDWRVANLACAVTLAVIAVLYLLVKDRPEELGLRPFGFGETPVVKQKANPGTHDWPGYTFKELLRRPSFYLMTVCTLGSCICLYITSTVLVAHFQAQGFSAQEAASLQSMQMLVLAGVKVLCGALCDKIGPKPVTIGCMVCAVVGQYMLGCTADPTLCYIATAILAVGMCMTALMSPLLTAPLFGYRSFATVNGIFMAMCSLATIFSNPISNNCFDVTGSYIPAFRGAALVNGVVLVLYLVLFALTKREKRRYFEEHPEEK